MLTEWIIFVSIIIIMEKYVNIGFSMCYDRLLKVNK